MKPHARAVLERLRARQEVDDGVGEPRLLEGAGRNETLSALDVGDLDAAQIQRPTVAPRPPPS